MDFKLLGSILLIIGTSIGAGMLALPIATAELGYLGALILLFFCWFVMTASALLILEVNLWLPTNSNLISMARATIGPVGQMIAWCAYLLLLYSLLCAYIAGGSDLLHNILRLSGISMPAPLAATLFTLLFGYIVFLGIRTVDHVNRGLMFVKMSAYILLAILLTPYISTEKLVAGNMKNLLQGAALTVTVTSFGYASIVPSLRIYFAGDVKKLRLAIFIGSFIPLVCYIIWDALIMGVIPLSGNDGLISILHSPNSTSDLVNSLSNHVAQGSVTFFLKLFTSICVVTSFLGASLCMCDFLADGLNLEKEGGAKILLHLLAFLPPLIIVLFFPHVFIKALQYAGIYCVILLILLPAWMAWQGRYRRRIAHGYQVIGGKLLLLFLLGFSIFMLIQGVIEAL